jgi:hypothetical protein
MAENLSSEEIENITKVFNYIDKYKTDTKNTKLQLKENSNGAIDFEELKRAIKSLNLSISDFDAKIFYDENLDREKKGIDIDTFIKLVSENSSSDEKNKALEESEKNMNEFLSSKKSRFSSGGRLHMFNPISTDNQMNYACNYKPDPIPRLENVYIYPDAEKFKPKQYSNFREIKGGQIDYFPNRRTVIDNFREPVFVNNSFIQSRIYRDPMGSIKPEYTRIKTKNNVDIDQLRTIRDTCEMREDILARQMAKDNRTRYEPKWNL